MANIILAYNNQVTSGSLSASSATTGLDATNLQDDHLSSPWQTSDATTAHLIIDAGSEVDWGAFGVFRTNLTTSAQARWRVGTNSTTNVLLWSESLDNAAWTKVATTVTADQVVAPDGASTADKVFETVAASAHAVHRDTTATVSQAWTFSCYAKAAERSYLRLYIGNAGSTGNAVRAGFDLSTGTVYNSGNIGNGTGVAAAISSVGSGWYRCSVSGTPDTSGTSVRAYIDAFNTTYSMSSGASYTGSASSGIYLWGAQLETGSVLHGYVPTTSAAATGVGYDAYDSGVISAGVVAGYGQSVHVPSSTVTGRYCRLDLIDSTNSDGFLRIGGCYAGPAETPTRNFRYGHNIGWQDDSIVTVTRGGQEYFSIGPQYRVIEFELPHLTQAELYDWVFDLDRAASTRSNILVIPDPNGSYQQQQAIFGRLTGLSLPSRTSHVTVAKAYRVKERL